MLEIRNKIEANAAARLVLPEGRKPVEELARYKAYLKVETHRLLIQHRAGGGGLEICKTRAVMLDFLLQHLWEEGLKGLGPEGQTAIGPIILVALGGYGRAELNPHSDVDVMFLRQKGLKGSDQPLSQMVDGILYPLWDIGLKVGHSVRTMEECVAEANTDMQSKTSLLESRLIAGDKRLYEMFQGTILKKCVEGFESQYIAQRIEDQKERRAKFGNSATMQEPNIKNGCGGLRDYQNLLWMAYVKYRTRTLQELQEKTLITAAEMRQLQAAYDFLLRVRTEMHYHVKRPMDVLTKSIQPAVAFNLGYKERSPSKRIESFMGELYTHSRNIFLITRTVEQRLALLPQPNKNRGLATIRALLPSRKSRAQSLDGFKLLDGQIRAQSDDVFEEDPRRLMRLFLYAQQRGLELHPDLAQLVRKKIYLANRSFLKDSHVCETFLTILNQRGNVAHIMRSMHEVGLLGRYIPEFGKLTCLVQHEFYHQYTADEHTLICLEHVDRVWQGKDELYKRYTPLLQGLERPFILYLALLLHDVGKAEEGRHCDLGRVMGVKAARRLGLDETSTETLKVLIEHHLLMAMVSQRRDLDDPLVIRRFAHVVKDRETLSLLTLHTFVDSQATSDKLWNGFKDSSLWSLFFKTLELLSGGSEFIQARGRRRARLREELDKQNREFSEEEIDAHMEALPDRYFDTHSAQEILEDLSLTHTFMRQQIDEGEKALLPVIGWHDELDRGFTVVKVCTWDRSGLFRKIAGSFSALGLNILSAQIFTRLDGIVLDTFYVVDARNGELPRPNAQGKFKDLLSRVLTQEGVDLKALIRGQQSGHREYEAYSGEQLPTHVRFENESSDSRTILEVETEDRIGLLYEISATLAELGVNIYAARISTERGAAIDSFYVNDADGSKITESRRQAEIEKRILRIL